MLTATVITRHYLASEYLWIARESARRCRELEDGYAQVPGHKGTHPRHRSTAIMAVMSAVSFLEALVNEIYVDAGDPGPGRADPLGKPCRELMAEYWRDADRSASALTKYQMALLFAGRTRFDKGAVPYQGANALISMRNALVHFKPSWHDDLDPVGLEKILSTFFGKSGLLTAADGSPWLIWALAAPGAEWAYATATTFADEWMDRMGLTRVYEVDMKSFEEQIATDGLQRLGLDSQPPSDLLNDLTLSGQMAGTTARFRQALAGQLKRRLPSTHRGRSRCLGTRMCPGLGRLTAEGSRPSGMAIRFAGRTG